MEREVAEYRFTLYVVGGQVGSARAEPDLRAILDAYLPGRYALEVVDVRERPDLAKARGIVAFPAVVRESPAPQRRVFGSLESPARVAEGLGLGENP